MEEGEVVQMEGGGGGERYEGGREGRTRWRRLRCVADLSCHMAEGEVGDSLLGVPVPVVGLLGGADCPGQVVLCHR